MGGVVPSPLSGLAARDTVAASKIIFSFQFFFFWSTKALIIYLEIMPAFRVTWVQATCAALLSAVVKPAGSDSDLDRCHSVSADSSGACSSISQLSQLQVVVMNDHASAFGVWVQALEPDEPPAVVVHIDRHSDLASPRHCGGGEGKGEGEGQASVLHNWSRTWDICVDRAGKYVHACVCARACNRGRVIRATEYMCLRARVCGVCLIERAGKCHTSVLFVCFFFFWGG